MKIQFTSREGLNCKYIGLLSINTNVLSLLFHIFQQISVGKQKKLASRCAVSFNTVYCRRMAEEVLPGNDKLATDKRTSLSLVNTDYAKYKPSSLGQVQALLLTQCHSSEALLLSYHGIICAVIFQTSHPDCTSKLVAHLSDLWQILKRLY